LSTAVVVSGLGAVGPYGLGAEALARSWRAGGPPRTVVDRSAGYHRWGGSRRALLAGGLDLAGLLPPALARRMSPPARLAVAAAHLALADAGLGTGRDEHAATGLVVGTAFGPAWVTERLLTQIVAQGPEAASPALFTESVASAAASQLALVLGARGPSLALTGREASDLLALADGARLVATGAARRALVIVVDEMTPLLHAVLDRFRALARPEADGEEVARPFDRRRSGALAAEGAAVLVLEREEDVAARGGRPRARLAAVARGYDPTAPAHDWGEGDAELAATLAAGLGRAGVAAREFDLVVSGGAGARRGDRLEARVLRRLFGDRPPPLLAPKAELGAWGGAFLAAATLAAEGHAAAAPRAGDELDPECGVLPATELPPSPRLTLVSSLASGGAAAWVALAAGQPAPGSTV
jgi:3-oxoacyl-[acyl-carrier-protein] synthase II